MMATMIMVVLMQTVSSSGVNCFLPFVRAETRTTLLQQQPPDTGHRDGKFFRQAKQIGTRREVRCVEAGRKRSIRRWMPAVWMDAAASRSPLRAVHHHRLAANSNRNSNRPFVTPLAYRRRPSRSLSLSLSLSCVRLVLFVCLVVFCRTVSFHPILDSHPH